MTSASSLCKSDETFWDPSNGKAWLSDSYSIQLSHRGYQRQDCKKPALHNHSGDTDEELSICSGESLAERNYGLVVSALFIESIGQTIFVDQMMRKNNSSGLLCTTLNKKEMCNLLWSLWGGKDGKCLDYHLWYSGRLSFVSPHYIWGC